MKNLILILSLLLSSQLFAQELAKFEVRVQNEKINAPVSVTLDALNYNTDKGNLVLYEVTSGSEKKVSSQLEAGHSARLWFILSGKSTPGSVRTFVIKREENTTLPESI